MLRRTLISAVAVGGLALMAIGSGGTTGLPSADPAANKAACEAYWKGYNELECLPGGVQIDSSDMCDIDNPYVDMVVFYDCMTENVKCVDGAIVTDGQGDCKPGVL